MAIIGIATASEAKAQLVSSNPLEWMALAEGNELINSEIEKQINGQTKTALLQNTMAAEFNQIHKWEKKYNSYLKSVNGYASSLKACTHLYDDGVKIFITLAKLKAAIANNPQGIVASMSMNKESRIPSPIQISINSSVLRPNIPNHPILSVEQPRN